MHKSRILNIAFLVALSAFLNGCAIRTYTVVKERTDQDLSSGNRGMLQGTPAPIDPNRQTTREVKVIEIELGRHSVSKKVKPIKPSTTQTSDPESAPQETNLNGAQESVQEPVESKISTYTVQKNDTLEKIAARPEIYGDGKKWYKIYKANKDTLKGPNNIYPGQIIKIPRD